MNTVTGARGVWGVLSETLLARVAMSSTLGLARELGENQIQVYCPVGNLG
jgi:hypothetical protein